MSISFLVVGGVSVFVLDLSCQGDVCYHSDWVTKYRLLKNNEQYISTGCSAVKPRLIFCIFLARDSIYAIARYMLSSVRLSVRLSHGWISQRRLKLGSRNLHHRVAP